MKRNFLQMLTVWTLLAGFGACYEEVPINIEAVNYNGDYLKIKTNAKNKAINFFDENRLEVKKGCYRCDPIPFTAFQCTSDLRTTNGCQVDKSIIYVDLGVLSTGRYFASFLPGAISGSELQVEDGEDPQPIGIFEAMFQDQGENSTEAFFQEFYVD